MSDKIQTRAEIIVFGVVQGVGYRYFVRKVAWKHGLTGNIGNMDDGTVRMVCEGERNTITRFVEAIDVKKPPMVVEKVSFKFLEATGEFVGFKILTGSLEEEMIEGFSTGGSYFDVMFDKEDSSLGKQDKMLDKQDKMLDKQDKMLDKQDKMLDKQDEIIIVIRDEGQKTRDALKEHLTKDIARLYEEIDEIKATLARVVEKVGA